MKLAVCVLFLSLVSFHGALAQQSLELEHIIELTSGRNATIMAAVSSDTATELPLLVALDCCGVEAPQAVSAGPDRESQFVLKVHAPLNATPGYHTLTVSAGSASKTITINVKESDLANRMPGLTRYADSLRLMASEEAAKGASMDDANVMLDFVSDRLAKARMALENDDEAALYDALMATERKLYHEIPLAISSAAGAASLRGYIWAPVAVIALAAGLILLRMRS